MIEHFQAQSANNIQILAYQNYPKHKNYIKIYIETHNFTFNKLSNILSTSLILFHYKNQG